MTVIITLTTAGADTGPFNLFSDANGYTIAFAIGVTKAELETGYPSDLVPDGTTTIKITSINSLCSNSIYLPTGITTTTTSSSTSTTTTTANPCTDCTLDNIVTIGSQIWTGCNLDVEIYANGDPIPEITDPAVWATLTTGAWCYYNNDPTTGCIYGKLYNWHAVNDSRGLAPTGYHVPSKTELETLTSYLGSNAGGNMKEVGITHWNNPNTDADNTSGFTGFGGGYRDNYGSFNSLRYHGVWWSSSEGTTSSVAWDINLDYYSGYAIIGTGVKKGGFSVRLIQD